jgi:hypothetical protein
VQWPFVVNSAYEHLIDWAHGGQAPPSAPRGEYQDIPADPTNQLARDELGIAQGGIRLPEMSVPARLNTGINGPDPNGSGIFSAFCFLLGSTEDLSDEILLNRYKDWADYVDQASTAAEKVAGEGFILQQDVPRLIEQHKQVPTLRPTTPRRRSGGRQNAGRLTLAWRGTDAPASTFELQHSADGGTTWSPVTGAEAVDDPSFDFGPRGEQEGEWVYRVRSNTTIPADAVREEYVVTTPWSETSGSTTVDRSAPRLKLKCPKRVRAGKRAYARIKARDEGVGLRRNPSGKRRIRTGRKGVRKIEVKAVDEVGNAQVRSCRVRVFRR